MLFARLRLVLSSELFFTDFQIKIFTLIFQVPIRGACPAHLIHLDFFILMFGEEYKLWSYLICSVRHSHHYLLRTDILLWILFETLPVCALFLK
jgi:hypothetical protein